MQPLVLYNCSSPQQGVKTLKSLLQLLWLRVFQEELQHLNVLQQAKQLKIYYQTSSYVLLEKHHLFHHLRYWLVYKVGSP